MWFELVMLVVPGFNDDDAQLTRAAEYIASVSHEIAWHVTAFHKDYKMTDPDNTSAETLVRACEIGARASVSDFARPDRSEEHTSELQSLAYLVCRLLLEKKKKKKKKINKQLITH